MEKEYNHEKLEKKWTDVWEKTKLYETDLNSKKTKLYNLIMFPYPSGEYLHIGHTYSDSGADVYGRYKRLNGFNIFMPIGYDSFGLPAENYALKKEIHPKESTALNIEHAEKQLKSWGCMFDWSKTVVTSDPSYYKWTQWLFLKLYEKGLAYQKEAPVNWCSGCKTVLANEQVVDGECERCGTKVELKNMKQWFFKTTDYADRLIKDLEIIDWPESSKVKQKNWIGRSEGINFKHKVKDLNIEFEVYDSIPQTFMAQTFVVIAPEHPMVENLIKGTDREEKVKEFVNKIVQKKAAKKFNFEEDMEGIFTGRYVENYLGTGKDIPIWVASFVLMDYGTGIVGCSAHDERDFQFAKKYDIPLKTVLYPRDNKLADKVRKQEIFYREPNGILEEPKEFEGLRWDEAREKIINYIEENNLGKRTVNYKLRDWSIGRQRYWGAPIPIIYCKKCGVLPVSENDLPVLLPEMDIKDVKPSGTGKGPLYNDKKFVHTKCPQCGGDAERETDTMDTFVCSSFYYLRYPSVGNNDEMMNEEITKHWLPVDMYVGGAEHVTMHLLYARFITKALNDLELIGFNEPFLKLRHQGMILGPDGKKMSKSKGNVIIPDEVIKEEGADAFRLYLMFMGPFEDGGPWNPKGLKGIKRFLERYWKLANEVIENQKQENPEDLIYTSKEIEETALSRIVHKTIKKVGEDIENFRFNTAVSSFMECINEMYEIKNKMPVKASSGIWKESCETFSVLLSPFAPFITEEIWEKFGNRESIFSAIWPSFDEELIKEESINLVVQVNGKVRDVIPVISGISKEEAERQAALSSKVLKFIDNQQIIKAIFVPDKLINLIIK